MNNTTPVHSLRCYTTTEFDCSYLANLSAKNIVIDPAIVLTTDLLGELLNRGFRRSGSHVYRPHCEQCQACLPLRVPVSHFKPKRSQRRCWQKNSDITHDEQPADFNPEHFALYQRYLNQRHPDSSMGNPSEEEYMAFLSCANISTRFHEFRLDNHLIAIAVTDHTPLGLSAVYTFYEPDMASLSLGTYAVLWQIQETQRLALPWLYLGYWIKQCPVMSYKADFKPIEYFHNATWEKLTK